MTFLEFITTIGIVFGSIAAFIGLLLLAFKTTDLVCDKIIAKRRREHPELYKLFDAIEKKGTEYGTIHNTEITSRKNQIDTILRNWNYYPLAVREQKERELEELRQEIETTKATLKIIADEKIELREQIHNYVEQHNLKWAKRMGW